MLDDFREQANASFLAAQESSIPETPRRNTTRKSFLGLTPVQRLLVSVMLLMLTCLLGVMLLLVTERVVLPMMM